MAEEKKQKKESAEEKARNYHVAKRTDGKWQVKFAGGEKAIKLFDTQAEAIAYAKKLAQNQEGSISIHKKDGKCASKSTDLPSLLAIASFKAVCKRLRSGVLNSSHA